MQVVGAQNLQLPDILRSDLVQRRVALRLTVSCCSLASPRRPRSAMPHRRSRRASGIGDL